MCRRNQVYTKARGNRVDGGGMQGFSKKKPMGVRARELCRVHHAIDSLKGSREAFVGSRNADLARELLSFRSS